MAGLLRQLAETFGLPRVPRRIEVFDNSHISGTNPVGAMIVAGPDGFIKGAYRKFTINNPAGAQPGDENKVMHAALTTQLDQGLSGALPEAGVAPGAEAVQHDHAGRRRVAGLDFDRLQRHAAAQRRQGHPGQATLLAEGLAHPGSGPATGGPRSPQYVDDRLPDYSPSDIYHHAVSLLFAQLTIL